MLLLYHIRPVKSKQNPKTEKDGFTARITHIRLFTYFMSRSYRFVLYLNPAILMAGLTIPGSPGKSCLYSVFCRSKLALIGFVLALFLSCPNYQHPRIILLSKNLYQIAYFNIGFVLHNLCKIVLSILQAQRFKGTEAQSLLNNDEIKLLCAFATMCLCAFFILSSDYCILYS
jgi:hypothetical protein